MNWNNDELIKRWIEITNVHMDSITFFPCSNIFALMVSALSKEVDLIIWFKWLTISRIMAFMPGVNDLMFSRAGNFSKIVLLVFPEVWSCNKSFSKLDTFFAVLIAATDDLVVYPKAVRTDFTGTKSSGCSSSSLSISFQNFG